MITLLLLIVVAQAPTIPKVMVTMAVPEEVRLVAGGGVEVEVVATVAKGFRIQANPASEPFLVPARLELEENEHVRVGPAEYPPGEPYRLRGASSDLSIYKGRFVIRLPVEAPLAPPAGMTSAVEAVLEGVLHYQACNEVVCLKPSSVPVRVPVRIEPPRTPTAR